ncbi:MAG: ECF transporter S component, partial [Anaerolineales bacterium]|nr:ECF transporter S component [Anaerolineales bacterium]
APIVTVALVALSLIALLIELQGQAISAKTVAMLGVLVAITSVLRFIEVVIPAPGGFSPVFAPIILVGYVFGGRFGFLMGTFTLLASALVTGGVGPWLPYQMYAAGWVGMSAGWLGWLVRRGRKRHGHAAGRTMVRGLEVLLLCALGFIWGLLFGAIMNIFFWPLATGPADQTWSAGTGLVETLSRYGVFYLATSLGWDLVRAVGNAALIVLLGAPVVRALMRFRQRFQFEAIPDA